MLKILRIATDNLFSTNTARQFPRNIFILADNTSPKADIDITIGSHRQWDAVNAITKNYLTLEKKLNIHIFVIESSLSITSFRRINPGANITRIFLLSPILGTTRLFGGRFRASNGAALAAQLGNHFGKSRYAFFSHSDMIGFRQNFLSFLLSKLDNTNVIAAFTQRHVLPFTGGMLYDRYFSGFGSVDWLPKNENLYHIPGLEKLRRQIDYLDWIDAGEQLIFESFAQGKRAYVCASRGTSDDYFGHPLSNLPISEAEINIDNLPIDYARLPITRNVFETNYPELTVRSPAWRKSFDDAGNVVFIHRGRGVRRHVTKERGDLISFARNFSSKIDK